MPRLDADLGQHGIFLHRLRRKRPVEVVDERDGVLEETLLTANAQSGFAPFYCVHELSFLPSMPFEMSFPLLFGVLLVAGMVGGEMARSARLPRIMATCWWASRWRRSRT